MIVTATQIVLMVVLHAPGGVEVTIVPGQVTTLRDPPHERGVHFPSESNCLIGLADGKSVPVVETCPAVRKLIEEKAR